MRTALSIAALAAGALAVPYKRDVVTDWDITYVTDVITVTAGEAPAATTPAASSSSTEAPVAQHYGHHNHPSQSVWSSEWATTWTEPAPAPSTTSIPAPAYTPPPSSTPEPAPTTSSTSTPVVQIPLTTYLPQPASTQAAPSSSAAASSSSSGGNTGPDAYSKSVVDSHNLHRSNHSDTGALEWDAGLASIAETIAKTCHYGHDTTTGGGGYGQNIAAGVDGASIDNVITDMFYNGEEYLFADAGNYGQANPNMSGFEGWGHFTQLVWRDTTHVGCYTTTADDCSQLYSLNSVTNVWEPMASDIPAFFTVCNYKNPGNYAGEYAANVGEPLGKPIVYASSS